MCLCLILSKGDEEFEASISCNPGKHQPEQVGTIYITYGYFSEITFETVLEPELKFNSVLAWKDACFLLVKEIEYLLYL